MQKVNQERTKKYEVELRSVKNYNRRIRKLNILREQKAKADYEALVLDWKIECEKIKEENDLKKIEWNEKNSHLLSQYLVERKRLELFNEKGQLISQFPVKILNKSGKQITINNSNVIVFTEVDYEQYADIVIESNVGQISFILHKDTVKLSLLDCGGKCVFVKRVEWGYEGVDGEKYGFLNTKEVPKFKSVEFKPTKIKKFTPLLLNLKQLPPKPKPTKITPYPEKPLPIIPKEVCVAVDFDNKIHNFNFGKWKMN